MFRRAFLAVFGAVALIACAPVDAPAQETGSGPVEIVMTRTVCYGFCPAYTLRIDGEGRVRYEGRQFVNVVGTQEAAIPRQDVERLLARFDEIGFDGLRDAYRSNVTDLPTTTISLTRNGRTKTVLDYGGTGAGMPAAVRELQREIDRVAGSARWVLRDGQPVRERPQP